jgi:hypothetical protein
LSKNVNTLWREAEKPIGDDTVLQAVDPLHVIETVMRYFYSLAPDRSQSQCAVGRGAEML